MERFVWILERASWYVIETSLFRKTYTILNIKEFPLRGQNELRVFKNNDYFVVVMSYNFLYLVLLKIVSNKVSPTRFDTL